MWNNLTQTFTQAWLARAQRVVASTGCFGLAVFLVYRGTVSQAAYDSTFTVPLMCTTTALLLAMSGIAILISAGSENGRAD